MSKQIVHQVQKLAIKFAKFHYNKYLKEHELTSIPKSEIQKVVENVYTGETKKELIEFIRQSLKKMYKENYNGFAVEQILGEISLNDDMAKERVCLEIELLQVK